MQRLTPVIPLMTNGLPGVSARASRRRILRLLLPLVALFTLAGAAATLGPTPSQVAHAQSSCSYSPTPGGVQDLVFERDDRTTWEMTKVNTFGTSGPYRGRIEITANAGTELGTSSTFECGTGSQSMELVRSSSNTQIHVQRCDLDSRLVTFTAVLLDACTGQISTEYEWKWKDPDDDPMPQQGTSALNGSNRQCPQTGGAGETPTPAATWNPEDAPITRPPADSQPEVPRHPNDQDNINIFVGPITADAARLVADSGHYYHATKVSGHTNLYEVPINLGRAAVVRVYRKEGEGPITGLWEEGPSGTGPNRVEQGRMRPITVIGRMPGYNGWSSRIGIISYRSKHIIIEAPPGSAATPNSPSGKPKDPARGPWPPRPEGHGASTMYSASWVSLTKDWPQLSSLPPYKSMRRKSATEFTYKSEGVEPELTGRFTQGTVSVGNAITIAPEDPDEREAFLTRNAAKLRWIFIPDDPEVFADYKHAYATRNIREWGRSYLPNRPAGNARCVGANGQPENTGSTLRLVSVTYQPDKVSPFNRLHMMAVFVFETDTMSESRAIRVIMAQGGRKQTYTTSVHGRDGKLINLVTHIEGNRYSVQRYLPYVVQRPCFTIRYSSERAESNQVCVDKTPAYGDPPANKPADQGQKEFQDPQIEDPFIRIESLNMNLRPGEVHRAHIVAYATARITFESNTMTDDIIPKVKHVKVAEGQLPYSAKYVTLRAPTSIGENKYVVAVPWPVKYQDACFQLSAYAPALFPDGHLYAESELVCFEEPPAPGAWVPPDETGPEQTGPTGEFKPSCIEREVRTSGDWVNPWDPRLADAQRRQLWRPYAAIEEAKKLLGQLSDGSVSGAAAQATVDRLWRMSTEFARVPRGTNFSNVKYEPTGKKIAFYAWIRQNIVDLGLSPTAEVRTAGPPWVSFYNRAGDLLTAKEVRERYGGPKLSENIPVRSFKARGIPLTGTSDWIFGAPKNHGEGKRTSGYIDTEGEVLTFAEAIRKHGGRSSGAETEEEWAARLSLTKLPAWRIPDSPPAGKTIRVTCPS